jgi:nitrogen regulatory protein P-II 1
MANLVVLVLECTEICHEILDAWEEAGASGATILESTGLARIRGAVRDDLPLVPSLRDLMKVDEMHNRTVFTMIDDDKVLERVLEVTRKNIDFTQPNSGLMFVVPVSQVFGLKRHAPSGHSGV